MSIKLSENAILWLSGGSRGVSSNTIFEKLTGFVMPGIMKGHPEDPSDFIRCLKLLDACPEFKPLMYKMREVSPVWAALLDRWDEIGKVLEGEVPDWREANGWSAPKTYKLMRETIEGAVK